MKLRAGLALQMFFRLIAAAMALLLGSATVASAEDGRGRFLFTGWEGPPLPVWYQLPEEVKPDTPVVVVMHGVNRDADRYRDEWAGLAVKHRFIVIVPEFSRADFPGAASYNTGFFAEEDGTLRPRTRWSFAAIEPLFDETRRRFATAAERYTIYGHSAGAQFAHRFVLFAEKTCRCAQVRVPLVPWTHQCANHRASDNVQQTTCKGNVQQTACSRQRAADSVQQTACSRQHPQTACSRLSTTCSRQHAKATCSGL